MQRHSYTLNSWSRPGVGQNASVTAKAARKAAKRAKERRRSERAAHNNRGLSRPLRLIVESMDSLQEYVSAADSVAAAERLALVRLRQASQDLAKLTAPYDVFDVLELVRLRNGFANPEEYKESEHEGSVAVIELAALVMAGRGQRSGSLPPQDGHRPRADSIVDQVQQLAQQALDAGSMMIMFQAGADTASDPMATLRFGTLLREVAVRNLSYPHMVEHSLTALFDNATMNAFCASVLGVTVQQVRKVLHAVQALHEAGWQARFDAIGNLGELARREMPKYRDGQGISDEVRDEVGRLWSQTWSDPADSSDFADVAVAAHADVPVEIATTVLDLFSTDMVPAAPEAAALTFFRGESSLRLRPVLHDPSGTRVAVHGGLLLPAIRPRVEQLLQQSPPAWNSYQKTRGAYVEAEALALLHPHLPQSTVHAGLKYFVPDDTASSPQTTPAAFTKLAEGDGLILLDDIAVIVEAKSNALSNNARAGSSGRLKQDLVKIVTKASEQADRMRTRIEQDRGLRLRDDTWLDLSAVREVHSIAVSLEDLSGIATITTDLVQAGVLSSSNLPWVVSLHDLRIISELIARPAELLLYLRRRTEPAVTLRYHAVDELDFFLHMYSAGLYVEPDPDQVARDLPQFGEPRVASRRRYKAQNMQFLTSQTDQLDAWYMHRLGYRSTAAPKPTLNAEPDLLNLVDTLAERNDPGWLAMGTTMLEGSPAARGRCADHGPHLTALTQQDGKPHTICVVGGTRANNSFLIIWSSRGLAEPPATAYKRLVAYVTAKKHQMEVARAVGLLFDPTTNAIICTHFDNRPPDVDLALDELVAEMGLIPTSRLPRRIPLRRKAVRHR